MLLQEGHGEAVPIAPKVTPPFALDRPSRPRTVDPPVEKKIRMERNSTREAWEALLNETHRTGHVDVLPREVSRAAGGLGERSRPSARRVRKIRRRVPVSDFAWGFREGSRSPRWGRQHPP